MSVKARHWIRPLKNGRVEWFMCAPGGQTCRGSSTIQVHCDLWGHFERWADCQLPNPEEKPAHRRRAG